MNRYKIVAGPDNVHWVSIEPLIQDTLEAMDKLISIDTTTLTQEQNTELNLKIAALKSVQEFFGALLTEITLEQMRKDRKNEKTN